MGLTAQDFADIHTAWHANFLTAKAISVAAGGFEWHLLYTQSTPPKGQACLDFFRFLWVHMYALGSCDEGIMTDRVVLMSSGEPAARILHCTTVPPLYYHCTTTVPLYHCQGSLQPALYSVRLCTHGNLTPLDQLILSLASFHSPACATAGTVCW